MRDRTTSSVAAVPTLRITSAWAGLMSSHSSSSFRRGSIQVRMATFGAGLFASEGSWFFAFLRFAAIAPSIRLMWILLNRVASLGSGLRGRGGSDHNWIEVHQKQARHRALLPVFDRGHRVTADKLPRIRLRSQ